MRWTRKRERAEATRLVAHLRSELDVMTANRDAWLAAASEADADRERAERFAALWKSAARAYRAGELEATAALELAADDAGAVRRALEEAQAERNGFAFELQRAQGELKRERARFDVAAYELVAALAELAAAIDGGSFAAVRLAFDRLRQSAVPSAFNTPSEKRSSEQCVEQSRPEPGTNRVGDAMQQKRSQKADGTEGGAEGRT